MLRALTALLQGFGDPAQLSLELDGPPRSAAGLLIVLRAMGMRRIEGCRLTRNRAVMVSFKGGELRVHEGYLDAPIDVLRAIVVFVEGRTVAERRVAREIILAYPLRHPQESAAPRRVPRTHGDDEALAAGLTDWHLAYNMRHFDGKLRSIPVRVSRRMRSRLGHYTAGSASGPAEIAISRRHVIRHGVDEALHTLLHEMVHQWQDETGQPIDHGAVFRAKAREIGIIPAARRTVSARRARQLSPEEALRLTAARRE